MKQIETDIEKTIDEWVSGSLLKEGDLFVIGCSTSEVAGAHIGTKGSEDIAAILYKAFDRLKKEKGVHLAFQCCEHLNRAIVLERKVAKENGQDEVSVVPHRSAGGSMATYAYSHMEDPVVVEHIKADAGIDIGETLIGMQLKHVAVPLRHKQRYVGHARMNAAVTRPKLIGGMRAKYL
ncbi:TIGR01440 family protein [Saliterribacillus persicus]|uniref:UPF0340 protein DFR57_101316 n=1 Tax=Saliterribacillus persicus TaxID=930114 RepID=A0A368YB63_9BACI|nr:TIGR01440 family protein [Saliterribacillus persicus]RCW77442.1 uncharacterized protein (TIGR01440 family) [Saliterribacillus persicus]